MVLVPVDPVFWNVPALLKVDTLPELKSKTALDCISNVAPARLLKVAAFWALILSAPLSHVVVPELLIVTPLMVLVAVPSIDSVSPALMSMEPLPERVALPCQIILLSLVKMAFVVNSPPCISRVPAEVESLATTKVPPVIVSDPLAEMFRVFSVRVPVLKAGS